QAVQRHERHLVRTRLAVIVPAEAPANGRIHAGRGERRIVRTGADDSAAPAVAEGRSLKLHGAGNGAAISHESKLTTRSARYTKLAGCRKVDVNDLHQGPEAAVVLVVILLENDVAVGKLRLE